MNCYGYIFVQIIVTCSILDASVFNLEVLWFSQLDFKCIMDKICFRTEEVTLFSMIFSMYQLIACKFVLGNLTFNCELSNSPQNIWTTWEKFLFLAEAHFSGKYWLFMRMTFTCSCCFPALLLLLLTLVHTIHIVRISHTRFGQFSFDFIFSALMLISFIISRTFPAVVVILQTNGNGRILA